MEEPFPSSEDGSDSGPAEASDSVPGMLALLLPGFDIWEPPDELGVLLVELPQAARLSSSTAAIANDVKR